MKRVSTSILAVVALLFGMLAAPAQAAPKPPAPAKDVVDVYTGELTNEQIKILHSTGVDRADVVVGKPKGDRFPIEVIMTGVQVQQLGRRGVALTAKKIKGQTARQRANALQENVFRPYSGAGNLQEEIRKVASDNPTIAKAVDIGSTRQGKTITAVRVSKNVGSLKDGTRPAIIYQAAQHAREWITPEMIRRLLHHYVDGYGTNAELTKIIDTTDLWFIPVVNVDGYDFTFTPDNRLWRKNLRDNNGDGQITGQDGVDPNRNFPYKWGYDNEGSSPEPTSETYRGPAPNSEPETQAQINLVKRIRPKYLINYHSAAQLLLYGVGWQSLTPSPDDLIGRALVGDFDNPAVPGYNPQLGAQLYTTNGETDGYMDNILGALSITPEMSTCEAASNVDPNDQWEPEDCGSGFEFPDDETLIQGEFAKNVPFVIAAAKSAQNPDHPVSPVGRVAADFDVDKFATSYDSTQEAASVIRRSLHAKLMHYKINGGRTQTSTVREWQGGERFGTDNRHYYGEYRGTVRGQRPGDRVEVWFSGVEVGHGIRQLQSEHFTYNVRNKGGAEVVVIADEDYKGVNPTYPAGTNAPRYASKYVDALKANKIKSLVWDIDRDGVPHDLGVLKHFKAAVWYLGDNRLTQDAADDPVQTVFGPFPDSQVADRALNLVQSVRSYINEGGRLLHTGETTGYFGPLVNANGGGIYFGAKGHTERPCVVRSFGGLRDDCELLSDDFQQYWLGAFDRAVVRTPTGFAGEGVPFSGVRADVPGTATNPINEAGGFQVTSTVLPAAEFPQFRSWKAGDYEGAAGPFEPREGQFYVAGTHQDALYRRLTRTIDLGTVTAAQAPTLQAQLSYSTETGFDNVIVEVHTVGQEDWTTLPDKNGRTGTAVPAECEAGYYLAMHPWLRHYLTGGNPCTNTGTSGAWNAFTGNSGGWVPTAFDLSAYAGKQIEVSIAYVSDPGSGGIGLFIDDTRLTTTGGQIDAEGFETGLGPWAIRPAPAGSPGNAGEFVRSQALIDSVAAVRTRDSVLLGFGLEQVKTTAEFNLLIGRSVRYLLS